MKTNMFLVLVIAVLTGAPLILAETDSPGIVGVWKTIDDETNEPKSLVEINQVQGEFSGRIIRLFRKSDEDPDPVCDKCTDERKDQKVLGMTILTGLTYKDGIWTGGTILDPKNGKTYRCHMKLEDNGNKLKVRGYIGLSLLGRTQYWFKSDKPSE